MTPLDSTAVLPADYSGARGGPTFKTAIISVAAGKEKRNAERWDAMNVWRLRWDELKKSEWQALDAFYGARLGRYQSFLFYRPYSITQVRGRFNHDRIEFNIDSGTDLTSCEVEVIEVHPGYADTPPTTFAADSGVEISNNYRATLVGGSSHSTAIYTFAPGIEKRTTSGSSIRKWQIDYGNLTLGDLNTLQGFFVARKGQAQTFLFKPPGEAPTVKVRFAQDEFAGEYYPGQTAASGTLELIQVL